jgi:iron complex transport system substrate-binding protein
MFRYLAIYLSIFLFGLLGNTASGNDRITTESLRIVTLSPSITETVFALGLGPQVVAVTDFCRWPEAVAQKPRIGGLYTLNIEKTLSLKPTLALHSADHRGAIDRLRGFGIRTVHVQTESMSDVIAGIHQLGEELGVPGRAQELTDHIQRQLKQIDEQYANSRRVRVLYVVDNSPGEMRQIYVLGPGTFLDDILRRAGAVNVMADSQAHYPLLSREYAIANPPEIIITSKREDTPQARAAWLEFLGRRPTNAPRFVFTDDPHLHIPGPSIGDRALELARLIDEARRQLD